MPISTDVRIIAATNKNLQLLISKGLFREDLFYRLNVVPLRIPPLRERSEDIAALVEHFLERSVEEGNQIKFFSEDAMGLLRNHNWPGNVRELENLVRKLAVLYQQDTIDAEIISMELSIVCADFVTSSDGSKRSVSNLGEACGDYFDELFKNTRDELPPKGLYHKCLREFERPLLTATLAATRGNQIKAAEILGINRNTLRKKIKELEITSKGGVAP